MKSAVVVFLLVSAMACSAAPDAYLPWPQPVSGQVTLQERSVTNQENISGN